MGEMCQRVAVCCRVCYRVLQRVEVKYSALQCVAFVRDAEDGRGVSEFCRVLQSVLQSVLQNVAECCSQIQCVAVGCVRAGCGRWEGCVSVLQSVAEGCRVCGRVCCRVLQRVGVKYSVLQCVAFVREA